MGTNERAFMKKLSWAFALSAAVLFTGCQSNSNTVWEDTKTMGRYLHRKGQLLWKQDADSRMIESEDEFVLKNSFEAASTCDCNFTKRKSLCKSGVL